MKLLRSSSLPWSLLAAFLFGYVGNFGALGAIFGSNVGQLCSKLKSDAGQRILAMGIISKAGGGSRFYAVSSDFEGITVPSDALHVPAQRQGQANDYPHINLNVAEALDLSGSKASWPQEGANGKGAFLLSFQHGTGLYSGEQFLAFISKASSELSLASLTNPETGVKRVPLGGGYTLPSGAVFSTDNKLTPAGDASIVASLRFVKDGEPGMADGYLRRDGADSLRFQPVNLGHEGGNLGQQVKPSLDGGFLLNGHRGAESRLFALSNERRKIYVFYGNEETPVEVPFDDFFVCPNEWLQKGLKATLGIAVPVIVVIGAVFFFMSAKKKKAGGGAKSAIGSSTGASTGAGKSTSKTGTSGKSRIAIKKPGTPKKAAK